MNRLRSIMVAAALLCACGANDSTQPVDGAPGSAADGTPGCNPACDATRANTRPVAVMELDGGGRGEPVMLDGSPSYDPDGDALRFLWILRAPEGSGAEISDPHAVRPSFVPDVLGAYEVHLTVSDGVAASDTFIYYFSIGNSPPQLTIYTSAAAHVGSTVTLFAGAFDPDGDALAYRWSLTARPPGSAAALVGETAAEPTLYIDAVGTYGVRVTVSDGLVEATAEYALHVVNRAPVARAGDDRAVSGGARIELDGSASSDEDGQPLSYRWSLVERPSASAAVLEDAGGPRPILRPDVHGTYVFSLVVNDGIVDSAPATVAVSAVDRVHRLPVTTFTAAYSRGLDRAIVALRGPAPALQVIDLGDGATQVVPLGAVPTALALSSDGRSAAVGHESGISFVDLAAGTVLASHPLPSAVKQIILGPTYAFAVLPLEYSAPIFAIHRGTGAYTTTGSAYDEGLTFAAGETTLYAQQALGLTRLTADANLTALYTLPAGRGQGPMFATEDRRRFFTFAGAVFDAGATSQDDLLYAGALEVPYDVLRHVDHAAAAGIIAVVPNQDSDLRPRVTLHDPVYHAIVERLGVPPITDAGGTFRANPLQAWFTADGRRLVIFSDDSTYEPRRFTLAVMRLGGAR